jgi:alkanesulfonate monooxygenase SsuD/methylene tetrahydromethanopterin reductase-like flavin-dependent oxidoreductase (luciferase family)
MTRVRSSRPQIATLRASLNRRDLWLSPLVYILTLSHPLRILEEICMLDQMSGGRLKLGVGR